MTTVEKCSLCGSHAKLLKSHVIPKFIVEWLKRTSATGYIRQGIQPRLRKQDIYKLNLLCADCESRFSKWEKQFAEDIFIPFQEKHHQSFEYKEWLLLFAISLAWRTVIKEIDIFREHNAKLATFVEKAINIWGTFLLDKGANPGPYDNHIFFLDFIANGYNIELPDKIHWYLLRGIDSAIVFSSKEVFAYTKLPGLIFWSGIQPPKPKGWERTLISRSGIIETPQRVAQPGFGDFLLDRAKIALRLISNISEKQRGRIGQYALKDPERTIASRSFEAYLLEKFCKERHKI